ncbi:hypothetical protein [Pelomonas aquatica]|uniref:Uncharacterized protein n=1 Tax=Pelomonas aquatica TaxID=431058 RepID=A0A9X4R602_9BURK|nr:hypothetical protein [Pelomonas aquatica]MCY4756961.1 hypothetical protein [Pelomonas aquatica]MDG0864251.1 hypothetical protein [Pelomonas aquatica]
MRLPTMPFRRLPAALLQLLLAFNLLAILGNVTGLKVLVAEAGRTPIVATLLNWVGVLPQGEPTAASGRRVTSMGMESSQAGESMAAGQPGRRNGMDLQAARAGVREQLQALHATPAGVTLTTTPAGQADALNQLEGRALGQRAARGLGQPGVVGPSP